MDPMASQTQLSEVGINIESVETLDHGAATASPAFSVPTSDCTKVLRPSCDLRESKHLKWQIVELMYHILLSYA